MIFDDTPMLDPAEVADLLGVPLRWVTDQARAGNLRGVKVGRRWRFMPIDIDEFIALHSTRHPFALSPRSRANLMRKNGDGPPYPTDWKPHARLTRDKAEIRDAVPASTVRPLAMTIPDAARNCGVTQNVIRKAAARGELTLRYPTDRPVVETAELERWIESWPIEAPTTERSQP